MVFPPAAPLIRVVAAVVEHDGRFLICLRPAHKRHGSLWEFPGGKCETGESDLDALKRELKEELDVRVTSLGSTLLEVHDSGSPYLIAFIAVTIDGVPQCIEHTAVAWQSPTELLALPLAPSDARFASYLRSLPQ